MPWHDGRDKYRPGNFWRIDDRSGFRVRASDTSKEWTGFITTDPDPRHPQEFVRGVRDDQRVPDPRPEAADTFILPGEVDPTDPSVLLTLRVIVSTDQRCIVGGDLRKVP